MVVSPTLACLTRDPSGHLRTLSRWMSMVKQARLVQVIMAFVDNWVQGVDQYVGWAGASSHVDFFTNPKVKQLYKDNVKALTSRVNTINGRKYSEDPTIFAWDLINEPRCNTECPAGTISVRHCAYLKGFVTCAAVALVADDI